MMCDRSAINMAIADEGTNTPVVEHDDLKSGSQKIETREDGKIAVNELVPAEAGKKDVHDGCSSSSDDNDDDCDDDEDDEEEDGEDEDDRNVGKGGTDGNTPVLQLPLRYTKSGRKRSIPFPVRLMTVLSDPKFHHIIDWLPSGKSFVIYKPKVFATDILPSRFKSAKYSSFTRKLHRWGFVRQFRGGDSGAFFHPDFQKGRLDLAESMTCCQQQKEAASKKARKAKLPGSTSTSSKSQAHADVSAQQHASSIRRSGVASFRNVMGGARSSTTDVPQPQNQSSQLHRSLAVPSMRFPPGSNLGITHDGANVPEFLSSGGNSLNPAMYLNATSTDLLTQQRQQEIMKARLDMAIREELNRIEFARLNKERLLTANAVHQYNALLQNQQRNLNMNNNSMLLETLPSRNDAMLGMSTLPFMRGGPSSSLLGVVGGGPSSSLPGGGGNMPQSNSLPGGGGNMPQSNSLAPMLSQLSRAELERYAMSMSARNPQHAPQPPSSTNFTASGSNLLGNRRSNPFK